jgi:hypothetical protein
MIELIQTYLIVSLTIYFFPFLLSLLTGNRIGSVFVMNFFLGWTFIGWVWALVWAVTPDRKQDQVIVHNHLPNEKVTIEREKTIQEVASSEQQIDKASLLNQLSQLHSLREKNVITEDMYEKEKQEILNKLQSQQKLTEAKKETEIQEPTFEPLIKQEEIYDNEYEQLFPKKKWYQKHIFWIVASAVVLSCMGFWFFKTVNSNSLPTPYSNTLIYKLDTVINNVNINGKQLCLKALYEKRKSNDTSVQEEGDYKTITFLLFKNDSQKPQLIKNMPIEEGEYIHYDIHKGQQQPLDKDGKLYLFVNKSFGGSGSGTAVYIIGNKSQQLFIDKIFECSSELDYIIYANNDNDILLLKGIWGENESHFANHRYTIKNYNFENGSVKETTIGWTKFRYSSLDEDKPVQQILTDMKTKEPFLLQTIKISDYKF